MKQAAASLENKKSSGDQIIVALDVDNGNEAESIVLELGSLVGGFKIGLQLFTTAGPALVRKLVDSGARIFLDLKFHDIPNTVARASVEAARLGVWMFNVHAAGGGEMMRRAAGELIETCERENLKKPKMIAVTVLTSSNHGTLAEVGIEAEIEVQVLRLAELTSKCGLNGVVVSPLEIGAIRKNIGAADFIIVTPGIRPIFATNDDQKRVLTPGDAIRKGADHLVIGRPITSAPDRPKAVAAIIDEIKS